MTRYHLVPGCNRTGKGVGWIKLFLWLIWMSRAPCDGKVCWLCHWKAKWKLLQSTAQVSVIHIVGAYQTDGKMHLTQFPTVLFSILFFFLSFNMRKMRMKTTSYSQLLACLIAVVSYVVRDINLILSWDDNFIILHSLSFQSFLRTHTKK